MRRFLHEGALKVNSGAARTREAFVLNAAKGESASAGDSWERTKGEAFARGGAAPFKRL